ncbi:O-methyltransferase [Thermodesulfobacteriota bacterium]
MKTRNFAYLLIIIIGLLSFSLIPKAFSQVTIDDKNLYKMVKTFLQNHQGTWRDMNVPESDGKILYDLIIKNNYKKGLEIGTSTGYSTIWIAWALSKTGGKIVTIEIDEGRYKEALKNFKEAGLSSYIDARLADAHKLVKELEGPFDFVFCDADKGWYKNYFIDVYDKLEVGGCYTAHNVSGRKWGGFGFSGTGEFYDYVMNLPNMETTVDNTGSGISISYKKSAK